MKRTFLHTSHYDQTATTWTLVGLATAVLVAAIAILARYYLSGRRETALNADSEMLGRGTMEEDPGLMEDLLEHNWQGF